MSGVLREKAVSMPKTVAASPKADSRKPGQSNGLMSSSRTFSMNLLARMNPRMPTGTLTQKIQRQASRW